MGPSLLQPTTSTGVGAPPLPAYQKYWSRRIPSASLLPVLEWAHPFSQPTTSIGASLPPVLEWAHPLTPPTTSTGVGASPLRAYYQYWSVRIPSPSLPLVLEWAHPLCQPTTSTGVRVRVSSKAGLLELECWHFLVPIVKGFLRQLWFSPPAPSPFMAEEFQSINILLKRDFSCFKINCWTIAFLPVVEQRCV